MTLILELTVEEEAALKTQAARMGLDIQDFVRNLIMSAEKTPGTADRIRGVLGDRPVGTGTSAWSEVEAACASH